MANIIQNAGFTGLFSDLDTADLGRTEQEPAQESPTLPPHTGNGPYQLCTLCNGAGQVARDMCMVPDHLRPVAEIATCPGCRGDGYVVIDSK